MLLYAAQRPQIPDKYFLHSYREHPRGAVSALAVAEAILGSMALFWLLSHESLRWGVLSWAVLTPLLLLRTKDATEEGVVAFEIVTATRRARSSPVTSLFALYVRWASILRSFRKSPTNALRAIPDNWRGTLLQTDFSVAPELVPGLHNYTSHCGSLYLTHNFASLASAWRGCIDDGLSFGSALIVRAWLIWAAMWLYLPPLVLRLTVKVTWPLFLALIWTSSQLRQSDGVAAIERDLRYVGKSDLGVLSAITAVITIIVLSSKTLFSSAWQHWAVGLDDILGMPLATHWVRPTELTLWQLAMFTSAVLCLASFWLARRTPLQLELGCEIPIVRRAAVIHVLIAIRSLLTPYIIVCNLIVLFFALEDTKLPAIRLDWLPIVLIAMGAGQSGAYLWS